MIKTSSVNIRLDRITDRFESRVKDADQNGLPYTAYLFRYGYFCRFLAKRDKDGNLTAPASKTYIAKPERDIKRLYHASRLIKVVRFDGQNKTETEY